MRGSSGDDDTDYDNVVNELEDEWLQKLNEFSKVWSLALNEVMHFGSLAKQSLRSELGWGAGRRRLNAWLSGMNNISGDRSIVQTLTSIDEFNRVTGFRTQKVLLEDADCGWHSTILNNCSTWKLKQWFVWSLLAELLHKLGFAPSTSAKVPYCCELFPIQQIFHDFCSPEHPHIPAPILVVFAVQMMLIAVIELEGDGDLAKLALAAKVRDFRHFHHFKVQIYSTIILNVNSYQWLGIMMVSKRR